MRTKSEKILNVVNISVMIFLTVLMLYPFLNQLAIAFNTGGDTARGGITIYPREFTLSNFASILSSKTIWQGTLVTLIHTVFTVAKSVILTFIVAYTLNKKEMPFRNALTWFFMLPMYIPVSEIARLIQYRYMHLVNSYWVYIIPTFVGFYNVMLVRSFFSSVSESYEEAAMIDGASEIQTLFSVIIPLCKPILITIALWGVVASWNSWSVSLYYITDPKLYELQYVLRRLITEAQAISKLANETGASGYVADRPSSTTLQAASVIFSALPIMIIFPLFQKYFTQGINLGGVKD